ncbi:hypothetical protein N9K76_01795 [Aquiluna sp.]|nr:hypothetical protein [Aquiluna sp.]
MTVVYGSSETHLAQIVNALGGDVCFWLDGHYSGGQTYRGETTSPILNELGIIADAKKQFNTIRILVDDVRLFPVEGHEGESGYPPLQTLVDFAQAHGFAWSIEHDIFIASFGSE